MKIKIILLGLLLLPGAVASAATEKQPAEEKSGYRWFNEPVMTESSSSSGRGGLRGGIGGDETPTGDTTVPLDAPTAMGLLTLGAAMLGFGSREGKNKPAFSVRKKLKL
ncbi:MAG: hypothetical protein LBR34_09850 [Prevotella sp.]|nr:hypothetical protein [Prevotella sp.]